jgi:hypothetical protein
LKPNPPNVLAFTSSSEKNGRSDTKSCFGTIFPDLAQFKFGKPLDGKVFQICVQSQGPGHRERKMEINVDAWEKCRQCPDFRNCYEFSMAKLEMQRALREL